jgi:hypothetical protein
MRFARLALVLLWLVVAPVPSHAEDAPGTTRWYEVVRGGKKIGWTSVTWTEIKRDGAAGIHDRTETVIRTARDMAGHLDVFETRTVIDLDRAADGTLWEQRVAVHESGRVTVETLRWTGSSYVHTANVDAHEQVTTVPLDAPVMTDAEAFLGERARAGTLAAGQRFDLRELDVVGKRARTNQLEVLGPEEVEGEAGPVATVKVVVRQPETRSETWLWLDRDGAFVQSQSDAGLTQRRVAEERAKKLSGRPPSFSITTRSFPALERVMSADRLWVEVALEDDPGRKLPDFPDSPWSTVGAPRRHPTRGWVMDAVLSRHDVVAARATMPIPPKGFERDLEPTPLMPCAHEDLVATARRALGGTQDAREGARRLARWVFENLEKRSLDVAQGGALEILEKRRGDCSEHALLYVALCRAAGIPARRCTGWVSIGPFWGAHAWAEVWVGAWIAADPTTGEVAPAARYLFFGYSDDPDSYPGVVSARVDGRIALRCTRLEEDGVLFDLDPDDPDQSLEGTDAERWFLHVASGIELRGLPEGWTALATRGNVVVRGPGLMATLDASADQGQELEMPKEMRRTFAGRPALVFGDGEQRNVLLQSRRRILQLRLRVKDEASVAVLERALEPTVALKVRAPGTAPAEPTLQDPAAYVGRWEVDRDATLARQVERLVEGLPAEHQERLKPRLAAMVERLAVDLDVRADHTYFLLLTRPLVAGEVKEDARGEWRVKDGRLDLRHPDTADGREQGVGELDAEGRLLLPYADWALVLRRVEEGR